MKHKLKTCLLLAAVVGFSSSLSAGHIQIISPNANTPYNGLAADGTSLTSASGGAWTFAAGTFTGAFSPEASNLADWTANWSNFNSTNWVTAPAFLAGKFDGTFAVSDAAAATWAGEAGYIWGYNSQAIEAGSEWVLVTNDTWVFPEYNNLSTGAVDPNIWNMADAGNNYIVGNQMADGFQTQAIPEPSTYALIFGLGILGFLGFRRFRK